MQTEDQIEKLLALTKAMHRQANEGSWEQLMITEKERAHVLSDVQGNRLLKPIDTDRLKQFQKLQNEIVRLALVERGRLSEAHQLSRSRIDASQQYLGFSMTGKQGNISNQNTTENEAN